MMVFLNENTNKDYKINLNEAYFEKHPLLEECERAIKEIQDDLKDNKLVNKHNRIKIIEKNLGTVFGFEKVNFLVLAEERYTNAFTIPFFNEKTYNSQFFKLEKNDNGIKFKDPKGKTLYVYVTIHALRNLTPDGVMSIILHEVGHNFFLIKEQITDMKIKISVSDIINILYFWCRNPQNGNVNNAVINALMMVGLYLKSPQKYIEEYFKKMTTTKAHEKSQERLKSENNFLVKGIKTLTAIVNSILRVPTTVLTTLLSPLILGSKRTALKYSSKYLQDYNAEKFSDNFAISYGYGVGIATFANNIDTEGIVYKIPIIRVTEYYNQLLMETVIFFNDPHPSNYKRLLFTKDKLEHELKKSDLLPEHKKNIEDELKKINEIIKSAPAFKKVLRGMFKGLMDEKDIIGSDKYSNQDIFDFDEKILNKYMTEDTVSFLKENYSRDNSIREGYNNFMEYLELNK